MKSFIPVDVESHFSLQNLPYGVFKPSPGEEARAGVAIGDYVLDLSAICRAGLFNGPLLKGSHCFLEGTLNAFTAMGRPAWKEARATIQKLLSVDDPTLRDNAELRRKALLPMNQVQMVLPAVIGDYTDFFSSKYHTQNCLAILFGPEAPIPPNWLSLPVAYHGRASSVVISGTDIVVDQFFSLKLPMRVPQLNGLLSGLDNALQAYTQKVVGQIGAKGDLIPPTPILTRYKKETGIKAFTKKKFVDPRLPDDRRSSQINVLSTAKLCVRLNSLHYAVAQLNKLEDSIRERWEQRRLHDNVRSGRSSDDSDLRQRRVMVNRPADIFSTAFDGTRKAVNAAIDKICEFTGIKIIFWDMKESFIDGLYKDCVSQARMETVVHSLDSVLVQLCDVIVDALRDRVVIGLLQASLDGLARVLLDGGPSRVFSQADAKLVEEDLQILKEFFMAGGDGIPRGVVENAASPVQQILKLYSLETHAVIENMRNASEQMATGSNAHRNGNKTANDADTLLRVLCHRPDSEASNFLKKQYKLPKSAG